MELNEYQKDDKFIIEVDGDIDIYSMKRLKESISRGLKAETVQLIVDLKKVVYIDSSGISVLITGLKKCEGAGGKFFLSNVSKEVMKIMELSQLHRLFKFC